ncbi:MAG: type IV secretion system DNA-binding domain-containing protein [bacterium]|nr:type IV secretion system DNA-binding domain-containing protein [bacterium]
MLVTTLFGFVLLSAVAVGAFFLFRKMGRAALMEKLQLELFLIRLPFVSKEGKELKQEIELFEQLLNALSSFRKPFVLEVAVPHVGEEIYFYAAAPRRLGETLARQIHALWSGADVERVSDYTIFNPHGVYRGAFLKQKDKFLLPIRTYKDVEGDPFSSVLGALAKMQEIGEGAAVQIIARPAPRSLRTKIRSALRRLQKGEELKKILRSSFSFESITETLSVKDSEKEKEKQFRARPLEEVAIKALQKKASTPLFRLNVRLLASAPTDEKAEVLLGSLLAGFSQFGAPDRNELKVVKVKDGKSLAHAFSFREFRADEEMILNSEEIASMFHFTTPFSEIPHVKSLKAKTAPPPSELPHEGVLLGESVYRGEGREVRIHDEDRRRHLYIVGQTGTGKSNLITTMAAQDIRQGKGVAIIDPHGDLAHTILGQIPESRASDVIVFDPSDLLRPLGLNMIEYDFSRPEQKTFIVNEMVSIFDKLYDLKVTGGPMFEQYMRNALLLLMEDAQNEPATLMEVARVFTDVEYRKRKLARIKNPTVQDFWQKEAEKAGGDAALANITPYITSKFNTFTANDYMRVIIGQEKSSINFRQVMDEGKVLIVNLSKGRIGDVNANLLGMIFVGKLLMAALSRVDMPEAERRDFNLYIDEFQNFTTDSISTILSEARKYHLNLVVAHQFIAQLSDTIRNAVFGNVGSIVSFRVGVQDTEMLVKEFVPVFDEHDLSNIDNFNAYVRLLVGGQTTKPFNIRTIPSARGDAEFAARLLEISRTRYGRAREEVEEGIYRRLRD